MSSLTSHIPTRGTCRSSCRRWGSCGSLGLFGGGIYVLDALGESRRENRLLREALIALSEQVPGGRLGSEEEIEWWLLEARAQRRAS
jgi:hypothetical protein